MSIHGVECPSCKGSRTRVMESRERKLFGGMRRRRKCHDCRKVFYTVEIVERLDVVERRLDVVGR